MGNSRKYPYPTTDGFHVLTPPCLQKSQNASPPCPQNSIIMNPPPLPFGISAFFWKYIFDLATPIWTNEHELMPPQGCDLAAPGDKLYSSATRKTYCEWPGCANSFLSLNFVYLRTTKVHNNSIFKELTLLFLLQKFLHAFGFPIVNTTPFPLEFQFKEPPPLHKSWKPSVV